MMVYEEPSFPFVISREPIPVRSVTQRGEIFYRTTMRLPSHLPVGGAFYLSGSSSTPEPSVIDDAIVLLANGTAIFSYDYATSGQPKPALVQVPRSVLEAAAGQPLTIEFVDVYGGFVSASPIYLIWHSNR
jgi:hypothetical protein